ncbi:MAG: glycosyltransferase 9 family protein [Herbaspirillum sp.]|nr:glycosyltransferase 9 family protein [Herbaspirillum sp.]
MRCTHSILPSTFDVHGEILSLPVAMKLQPADLPGSVPFVPYLAADPVRVAEWRERLAHIPRPLVALVARVDLAPLVQAGITSLLQKGPAAAQAAAPPDGMTPLSLNDEITDFEDTAAILAIADLLVSVDSSPVPPAGASGRPAWVMLPFVPDWRLLMEREDTSWYPDVRLLRQSKPDDWGPVLNAVARQLACLKAGR